MSPPPLTGEGTDIGEKNMENEIILHEIRSFLDGSGRLTALPAKYKKKLLALYYLAEKVEENRHYTESEINDLLDEWSLFHDPATLRREMFNKRLLNRADNGSEYWKGELLPPEEYMAKYL